LLHLHFVSVRMVILRKTLIFFVLLLLRILQ